MADSINSYTGSTAAMALLRPTVSYAQVRADKDRQLQYQAALTQDAEAKQAQAQQAAGQTQQAVASLADVPFLEQDQNRWRDFVDTMLEENEKRVQTDYGGDRERYGKERYALDTQNMILKATKSPLFKASLKRRADVVQLMADQSKGLIDRPVTYKLMDGTMKTAPATQNYLDFQAGKTADFSYSGGYTAPTKFNEYFGKNYNPKAAADPRGKYAAYQAGAGEIAGAMISEDGMNPADVNDYLSRFGNRLGPVYYKFDPRDPLAEAGLKVREQQVRQSGQIGWYNAKTGRMNAATSSRNADTNARRAATEKQAAGQGFNAYGTTLDNRNIITVDANGVPTTVKATIYEEGKAQKVAWSMTGYDSQLIQPQMLAQLGIKPQKTKNGTAYSKGRLPADAFVVAPNNLGGYDFRKTDLKNLDYQVVGAGPVFRRNLAEDEKSVYQKAGGPETLFQQLTVRLTANEALKAKYGKLFQNVVPGGTSSGRIVGGITGNVDSITGAGAYREVDEANRINEERTYDFDIVVPVTPTAATRVQMENSNPGRYMDSKAGGSSMGDYNNEQAPVNYDMFGDLENDF